MTIDSINLPNVADLLMITESRSNALHDLLLAMLKVPGLSDKKLIQARMRPRPRKEGKKTYWEAVWPGNTKSLKTEDEEEAKVALNLLNVHLAIISLIGRDPRRAYVEQVLAGYAADAEFNALHSISAAKKWRLNRPWVGRLIQILGHVRVEDLNQKTITQYALVCKGQNTRIANKTIKGLARPLANNTISRATSLLKQVIERQYSTAQVTYRPVFQPWDREHCPLEYMTDVEFYRLICVIAYGLIWDDATDRWLTEYVDGQWVYVRLYIEEREGLLRYVLLLALSGTRDNRARATRWVPSRNNGYVQFIGDRAVLHRAGYGEDPLVGKPAESAYVIPELAELLRIWSEEDLASGARFVIHKKSGKRFHNAPSEMISRAAKQAGIKKTIRGHCLLHTFLTASLKSVSVSTSAYLSSKGIDVIDRHYRHWELKPPVEVSRLVSVYGFSLFDALHSTGDGAVIPVTPAEVDRYIPPDELAPRHYVSRTASSRRSVFARGGDHSRRQGGSARRRKGGER